MAWFRWKQEERKYQIEIEIATHTIARLAVDLLVERLRAELSDKPDKIETYRKSQISPFYFKLLFKRRFSTRLEALEYANERERAILEHCRGEVYHGRPYLISPEDIETVVK